MRRKKTGGLVAAAKAAVGVEGLRRRLGKVEKEIRAKRTRLSSGRLSRGRSLKLLTKVTSLEQEAASLREQIRALEG